MLVIETYANVVKIFERGLPAQAELNTLSTPFFSRRRVKGGGKGFVSAQDSPSRTKPFTYYKIQRLMENQ
jgi:hypothetical protein